MKTLILFSLLLIICNCEAQESLERYSENHGIVSFGMMEDGTILSLTMNYDILSDGDWGCSVKGGVGFNVEMSSFFIFSLFSDSKRYVSVPLRISALYSKNRSHFLELGLASAYHFNRERDGMQEMELMILPVIGYKYIKLNNGFTLRVFDTWPVYKSNKEYGYNLPVGVSIGGRLW
jgi:hypothetical protein